MNLIQKNKENLESEYSSKKSAYNYNKNAKILLYYYPPEDIYPINKISNNMVVVGPRLNNSKHDYVKAKINVKEGRVDLNLILEKIKNYFNPEILISTTNPSGQGFQNISCFKGVKVLVLYDSHHMENPISNNVYQCTSEPYDLLITQLRQYGSFFNKISKKPTIWLPGFFAKEKIIEPKFSYIPKVAKVGQISLFHIRRNQILSKLLTLTPNIDIGGINGNQVFDIYNKYAMSLNISLNGDMNFRWNQVLSAGGVLLSDKLCDNSGSNYIFSQNEIPTFNSINEALEIIGLYINDPEKRYNTAILAQRKYIQTISKKIIFDQFWAALNNKKIDNLFNVSKAQPKYYEYKNVVEKNWQNIYLYQIIQECIRISSNSKIVIDGFDYDNFKNLNDFFNCEILFRNNNFLNKTIKSNSNKKFDCFVLVTKSDIIRDDFDYDFIILKANPLLSVPKNYKIINKNKSFLVCKRKKLKNSIGIDILKLSAEKNKISLSDYQESIIEKVFKHGLVYKNNNLLVCGENEISKKLRKTYKNLHIIENLNENHFPFFDNESYTFDIIINFDNSKNIKELSVRLKNLYGYMNLSSILIFHTNSIFNGPYGNLNFYPIEGVIKSPLVNPWSHLDNLYSRDLFSQNEDQLKKSSYNLRSIKKAFYSQGFKVFQKFDIMFDLNAKKTNVHRFYQDQSVINNSHAIYIVEKATWNDVSVSNLRYMYNIN